MSDSVSTPTTSRWPIRVRQGSSAHRGIQAAMIVAAALVVYIMSSSANFRVGQFANVFIFAIAISGLNVVTGYAGLLSIGHSAFYGLGAYTTGVLIVEFGWEPLYTIPVAMLLCFVVGVVLGLPAIRIKGLYLALVTLAIAVAFPEVIRRFSGLTGGATGLTMRAKTIAPPGWTGLGIGERNTYVFWLALVVLLLTLLCLRLLTRSRWGLAMVAVRDSEVAAASSGIDVARVKTLAFGLSGAITGMAGSLLAIYLGALSPEGSFTLVKSIELITGMVVGGAAMLMGPVVGAFAVVFIPYFVAKSFSGQMAAVVFGVVLILIVFVLPRGVVGSVSDLIRRFLRIEPAVDDPVIDPTRISEESATAQRILTEQLDDADST